MDELNIPQSGTDRGWPEASGPHRASTPPPPEPGAGHVADRAWQGTGRHLGTRARWAIGLGALALAGACVLGVTVASGGNSPQPARAALTGAAAGAAADAGSPGFAVASSGDQPGAAARGGQSGLRACVASARHLRATGHLAAARAKLRTCLSRYLGATKARIARIARLARRAMHGQITVATKDGPKTIAFERGTVQSVSADAIVVKAPDGLTWTWQLGGQTRVFRAGSNAGQAGHSAGTADLSAGQRVAVGGLVSGGTNQARRIVIRESSPA